MPRPKLSIASESKLGQPTGHPYDVYRDAGDRL